MLKDVCCRSHAFLVTSLWAGPYAPWEGQNLFVNTYSYCLSSHGLATSLPVILWATGNSFLLAGSAELFYWLLCALSTVVLAIVSHVEKLLASGFSVVLFSWLCAMCIQCLLCFPLSRSCINEAKLSSRKSWTLHGFWTSMQMSSVESDEFVFLSSIGSYTSSFVSFLPVNICQLMLFQEMRRYLVLNTGVKFSPLLGSVKTTVASFKLYISWKSGTGW